MLSIVIPSRQEKYLDRTVRDLMVKAEGPIEIIVVLDGADTERIDGVQYIYHPVAIGMKDAINSGVAVATGKYLMKIDAHCIVAPGFDTQLIKDHQDTWVQVPRRYKLDEEHWKPKSEYVDYEHFIFPLKYDPPSLHGFKSPLRQAERKDIPLDDLMTFQGSCYFLTREYWDTLGFLKEEGYGTLPAQEATYIGNTVWTSGGRVVVNKNTWYAHWFKGKDNGRGYFMDRGLQRDCYEFSYNYWVNERKDDFVTLIERFWPVPDWPANWKQKLWTP